MADCQMPITNTSRENGAMSYNAQRFTENHHLGDDLNGIGGENSDLGDPIYAIADGRVLLARDGGPSWGNVVIVLHAYIENGAGGSRATTTKPARVGEPINGERKYVQSYYATCKQCWCTRATLFGAASKAQRRE